MSRVVCRWAAGVLALAAAPALAEETPRVEPIPLRTQAPLLRALFLFPPLAPDTLAPGDAEASLVGSGAAWHRGRVPAAAAAGSEDWRVTWTGAAYAAALRLRAGVLPGLEVGIEATELAWDRNPKEEEPHRAAVVYDGVTWLEDTGSDSGAGDPVLWGKLRVTDSARGGLALAAAFTVPGGERRSGFGTGGPQGAVAVVGGGEFSRGLFADATLAVAWPGRPDGLHGDRVDLDPILHGSLHLGADLGEGFAFHIQVLYATNPFPRTGDRRADEPFADGFVAVSWRPVTTIRVALLFGEDLRRSSPDFTAGAFLSLLLPGESRLERAVAAP